MGILNNCFQWIRSAVITFVAIIELYRSSRKAGLSTFDAFSSVRETTKKMRAARSHPRIKDIAVLSRLGVSFTEEQKEQIKLLVDLGEKAEAQQIILVELNKQLDRSAAEPLRN